MEWADATLHGELRAKQFAGNDLKEVQNVARGVGEALAHMHSHGRIHGNDACELTYVLSFYSPPHTAIRQLSVCSFLNLCAAPETRAMRANTSSDLVVFAGDVKPRCCTP